MKLTFYRPSHVTIEEYIESVKERAYYNIYKFRCSLEELIEEKRMAQQQFKQRERHDMEWFHYLKSVGGYRNLVRGGLFNNHSPELRQLIRKGIPIALRVPIWPQISLSTVYRLSYSKTHFHELVALIDEKLSEKVAIDIEKDIGRYEKPCFSILILHYHVLF